MLDLLESELLTAQNWTQFPRGAEKVSFSPSNKKLSVFNRLSLGVRNSSGSGVDASARTQISQTGIKKNRRQNEERETSMKYLGLQLHCKRGTDPVIEG